MVQILGYPLLSWLPIFLILAAFILSLIDDSYKKKDYLSATYKIATTLSLFAATALTFLFGWRERWLALILCIFMTRRLSDGIKLLKSLKHKQE